MFTITEILNFLESNFPMCRWQVEKMSWQKGEMIAWHSSERVTFEVFPSKYPETVNNGAYYISLHWDSKKTLGGGAIGCDSYDKLKGKLTNLMSQFIPKLFEDQQLTLF